MQKKNRFKNFLQGIEFNTINISDIKNTKRRRSKSPVLNTKRKLKRRISRSNSPVNKLKKNKRKRRSRSRSSNKK